MWKASWGKPVFCEALSLVSLFSAMRRGLWFVRAFTFGSNSVDLTLRDVNEEENKSFPFQKKNVSLFF